MAKMAPKGDVTRAFDQARNTLGGVYAGLAKLGVPETAVRKMSEQELARVFRA